MALPESTKLIREQGRGLRYSTLLGNVLAIVIRPTDSLKLAWSHTCSSGDHETKLHSFISQDELFKAFISVNKTSMNSRLVESLEELKMVAWISPHTLLLSGPYEDIERLKTAWSRRTLRSPPGFLIRELGE